MIKYIWSLDISTTNIGSSLWDLNGNLIELKHLELKINKNNLSIDREIYKAEIFQRYINEFKFRLKNDYNGELENIIVEEPLGGSNNPSTASLLFGFNGICRYILYKEFNIIPIKISVYESRKLFCNELVKTNTNKKGEIIETLTFPDEYKKDKKRYIWNKVTKLEPNVKWFYKKDGNPKEMCFDMSDSYAVGYAGLVKLGIIKI